MLAIPNRIGVKSLTAAAFRCFLAFASQKGVTGYKYQRRHGQKQAQQSNKRLDI
jgi:hypothetical protein